MPSPMLLVNPNRIASEQRGRVSFSRSGTRARSVADRENETRPLLFAAMGVVGVVVAVILIVVAARHVHVVQDDAEELGSRVVETVA